ncbi:hypothetical protein TorRG33x02_163140 [Trema orientale]|uniref:Uncharacterized protein n=1 Tax=Trema orientale TaxID=63057 RepID=A0A2P5ER35_TREOI|nr:hypothetical protein TorRG33x02_163140 [Trema orientale]
MPICDRKDPQCLAKKKYGPWLNASVPRSHTFKERRRDKKQCDQIISYSKAKVDRNFDTIDWGSDGESRPHFKELRKWDEEQELLRNNTIANHKSRLTQKGGKNLDVSQMNLQVITTSAIEGKSAMKIVFQNRSQQKLIHDGSTNSKTLTTLKEPH